jgi:hypothetical protein
MGIPLIVSIYSFHSETFLKLAQKVCTSAVKYWNPTATDAKNDKWTCFKNALINFPKLKLLIILEQDSSLMDVIIMFMQRGSIKYMRHLKQMII